VGGLALGSLCFGPQRRDRAGREADRRAGAVGFGYAAALGSTLVYSGEHYVADLLLGTSLALLIHGIGAPG